MTPIVRRPFRGDERRLSSLIRCKSKRHLTRLMLRICWFLIFGASVAALAQEDNSAGAKLYGRRCAGCHDSGAFRMPARAQLQSLPSAAILRILNGGVMKRQAASMTPVDRETLSRWLG